MADKILHDAALQYHACPKPGKISIEITKPADTSHDLTLAYSPGVAEPVREIAKNPEDAYKYTIKGNLVAVISNGTAILGLGNLGFDFHLSFCNRILFRYQPFLGSIRCLL